jgi:hypothetical protein
MLSFGEQHPEYEQFFRYTHCPEEHYFHTIVQNSHYASEAAAITPYTGRGMWKTANLHIIHPSLKKIYTLADLDEIRKSSRCFVRKVTTAFSTELLDQIDSDLRSESLAAGS